MRRVVKVLVIIAAILMVLTAAPWALRKAADHVFPPDEIVSRACKMRDGRTGEIVRSGFWRGEYCRAEHK